MMRDFTFIDDVVEAIFRCCYKPATIDLKFNREIPNSSTSFAPHRIFNLGGENPIKLTDFIEILEDSIGKKAIKNFLQLQPGDVEKTAANNSRIKNWLDFQPKTTIVEGIDIFIDWYKKFYKV